MLSEIDPKTVSILVSLMLANVASIIGNYVSTRVAIARLEVKVDNLERDVNNLGDLFRKNLSNKG